MKINTTIKVIIIHNFIEGKNILITGGTGSLARPLIRDLLQFNPKVIRIFDIDETEQFEMQHDFNHTEKLRYLLGDIRDKERLKTAMENIDVVFHLAALKHVLACEYNPFEAVKTNILGTQHVIDAALETGVSRVIYTSSDKAVNPNNTMGATKLLAERLIIAANYYKGSKKTIFSSVRFGNILWSRGSVGPLFKKQLAKGGPITITDPTMTRFFMSPEKAVGLLFKCLSIMQGGEIFVFKMPVITMKDFGEVFVEKFASHYHYDPQQIKIEIIGIKPGETMSEELMTEQEAQRAYELEDLFIIPPEIVLFQQQLISPSLNQKKAHVKGYDSRDEIPLTKREIDTLLSESHFEQYLV